MDRKTFLQLPLLVPLAIQAKKEKEEEPKKKKATTAAVAPRQCSTCLHYASTSRAQGNCELNPKTWVGNAPVGSPQGWAFPVMNAGDSCGRYEWGGPS